jgi:hypothetical protein
MWQKKGALWLWGWSREEKPSKKVADRPHWITVVIGTLSPALALAALYISIQSIKISERSLNTSQQSMKVAQRAYLAVRDGDLECTPTEFHSLIIDFNYSISNLGNTPARITSLEMIYHRLPKGWSVGETYLLKNPGEIAPRTTHYVKAATTVYVRPAELSDFKALYRPNGSISSQYRSYIEGRITYDDVFNETQVTRWCWMWIANTGKGLPGPRPKRD